MDGALCANVNETLPIDHFRKAIRLIPAFADAHYNLGLVLQKQGKEEEAMTHFFVAKQINPAYRVNPTIQKTGN